MSEFGDEIKALRILIAEQGIEVTLERLLEILEKALDTRSERDCVECLRADLGLCFECLKKLVTDSDAVQK